MNIAPIILKEYPNLNDAQREIIGHCDGPLLGIAGPGSGKTFSLVLRAMNLLVLGTTQPNELIICTFTEKAAFELRDRISAAARKIGYTEDLSELNVSTIHGLCNRLITKYRHKTSVGNNYETLDELTQILFIFEHFKEIVGIQNDEVYFGKWTTKWRAIEGMRGYFNKITEELVDPVQMQQDSEPFLSQLSTAYKTYQEMLFSNNRLDFAHLQKLVYDLLSNSDIVEAIRSDIKYVMVDEYQDTNFIQEQILLKLTEDTRNLCVVGDEDQSLYRFRGATVRNILEFPERIPGCPVVKLETNYRSHQRIIQAYNRWMASASWSNRKGRPFRYDKTIVPDPNTHYPEYPAVFSIWGENSRDAAERFADMAAFLKENDVIADYNQIALLLHSVRQEHSGPYLNALETKGIPAFCPRARAYFDNDEVRLMVACFAVIFGYYGEKRGEINGHALLALTEYVDEGIVFLGKKYGGDHPLAKILQQFVTDIENLKQGESLDLHPADYFYHLLAFEPFKGFMKNENRARNLAILSQLFNAFQNYYHYTVVTHRNREFIRFHLFNSFLRLLHAGGINEYEDQDQPFPKGHVQMMTIHQAKGLEFPVVVVGSLDKQLSTAKQIDRNLQSYYHRSAFEPANRITLFDRMRLHYVAFSRAEKVLVLTTGTQAKSHFNTIWQGLPQWPYVQQKVLAAQSFAPKDRMPVKRAFSFTGDLKVYETCARQYQFFREYDFTPSRSAVIFFGLLVHQTIEEIHRSVLDGELERLNEGSIKALFDQTFKFLSLSDVRPIGEGSRHAAFRQVMGYFTQNQDEMTRVIETEVDVSVEKNGYILTGKVDLLMGGDGRLELLDFKTSPKPVNSPELLNSYERQLCTYAHILEKRYNKRPERLLLYWTSESGKQDALMELPYHPQKVEEAGAHFDRVVKKITQKEFHIQTPPESNICKECDLRLFCGQEGIGQTEQSVDGGI
ncbi:MAG: ATP-dependent helicase [bacterium]|nr:ATP-dependent helicase [bacterium]